MTYQNLGYWIGQANDTSTGSHPTGWTNGQRWSETASEWQTMYNTASGDATLWHGRADQAWGASRVWSSGESWEAAYTRVLPPAGPVTVTTSGSGGNGTIMSATTDRAGYWSGAFHGNLAAGASAGQLVYSMTGALTDSANVDASGTASLSGTAGLFAAAAYCAAGATVSVTCNDQGTISGSLILTFIPTAAYPH